MAMDENVLTPGKNYRRTLVACYLGFVTQAICANFAPLLYVTFYVAYGTSLMELALISTVFYFAQLVTDVVAIRFVDRLGYRPCLIASAVFAGGGLLVLAVAPDLVAEPFGWIVFSVVLYAVGSGLIEVLCSPVVEACPFENKASVMSLLHSFYCWGTVGVIVVSTLFFAVFGLENWKYLAVLWAMVPLYNIRNFATCPIERLVDEEKGMSLRELFGSRLLWLLAVMMVCAGASEVSMLQWASAFTETALHVSKDISDLVGPTLFAVFMGISRTLYGKFGERVDLKSYMLGSGALCVVCYSLAALSPDSVLSLAGCAVCGFSVGIMWPGMISISARQLTRGGTALFAVLALAGDLGGTVGPSLVGAVSQADGDNLKTGILYCLVFPAVLIIGLVLLRIGDRAGVGRR